MNPIYKVDCLARNSNQISLNQTLAVREKKKKEKRNIILYYVVLDKYGEINSHRGNNFDDRFV